MNEKLQISLKDGKAYAHSLTQFVQTPADGTEEQRYLIASQVDAVRQQQFDSGARDAWFGNDFGKVVSLLHFSDIHGDATELERIVNYLKLLPSSIVPFFTGDMVRYNWTDGISFWESISGVGKIMNVIGNHDSLKNGNWYGATAAECYARYIAPFVSSWGVVSQANLCYYYKDWARLNVRLIVLDVMHWDTAQENWLTATLASAKTAGYHVVVAGHCVGGNTDNGTRECSFDTMGARTGFWESESYGKMNASVPIAVQDFIDAGGHFICYLCGHTHADLFRHLANYPNQLCVVVANASTEAHMGAVATCQLERIDGKKSQDLFNLVTINPIRKILSVVRVGADHDTLGRHIGSVVYDYANHQILWND